MRAGGGGVVAALAIAMLTIAAPAAAFDPQTTFAKGTRVISPEGGYGSQLNQEGFSNESDLQFWNVGVRVSLLPFGTTGSGPLFGALEAGLEPFYQRYFEPKTAFFGGLGAVFRYHFLSLGRVVPYAELAGFAGGTDLRVPESQSAFTFLAFGGVGGSYFVTDTTAVYAGYRYQHVSNGNTSRPNRGFEANLGVVGVSFYLR